MKVIKEIENECFLTIAKHYAEKIKAKKIDATEEEIKEAMIQNWDQISKEISKLYIETIDLLQK